MNGWVAGVAAGVVAWFLVAKENRALVAGKAYQATFQRPSSMPELSQSQLESIMPAGSGFSFPDGTRNIVVTFIAPRSAVMKDVPTPLGTLTLVSLKEMG